jgi:uncharacterized membrane protein YgcG
MLFALLGSGALSRSVEGFAWALVAYVVVLIGLVASEFRRWITREYFARGELLPVLVAGGFVEALLAGALLDDVLVERDPLALVVSVPVLLVLLSACDLMIAAKIGASEPRVTTEPSPEEGAPEEGALEGGDEPEGDDWLQEVDQPAVLAPALAQAPNPQPAHAPREWWRVVLDLGKLGVIGAEWIAPVAVLGVFGVCIAVAIGGVPKGASTSTIGRPQKSVPRAGTGSKSGGSGGSGSSGGSGGSGGSGTHEGNPAPWNGPCTDEGRDKVSKLAFERMVHLFEELHLEDAMEGCIADLEGHPYRDDYYVTAVGVEQPTGEPLSFAVQSERCGGALVLNEARKAVEEVMAKAGPVCGVGTYPRYWVKDSDYYFLRSPHGVWIIFRRSQADKYEIMQPGLVRTWYHAMLAVSTWLWPSPPQQLSDHILRYEMWSYRNTERPEVIVKFNERTGTGSYPGQSYSADSKFEPLRGKLLNLAEDR